MMFQFRLTGLKREQHQVGLFAIGVTRDVTEPIWSGEITGHRKQ